MLAKLLAPGRYLARCLGSGAPPTRGVLQQIQAATWAFAKHLSSNARDPGAATHGPPYWHRQQLNLLQRASHQHGIASNFTTRLQHSSRGGKSPPSASPADSIRALGKQKRWQDAFNIFNAISKPTALEARALLATMAYNHQPRHAMTALRRLQGSGAMISHDYELAIQAHEKGLPFEAMELLREMKREGFRWTHRACSTVLQASGKAGRLNAALQLIKEMQGVGMSPNSLRVDFQILICNCVRDERVDDETRPGDSRGGSKMAMTLLQLMRDARLAPDVLNFNAALRVCARERNPVSATTIFQQMATQTERWQDALHIFNAISEPTALEVRALLKAMACSHQPQHAMIALRRLQVSGANSHDYELAIQAYENQLPFKAMELLREMKREGFGWTHRACSAVLLAFGKAGRLNAAVQLIKAMQEVGISPDKVDFLMLTTNCVRDERSEVVTPAGDSRGGSKMAIKLLQLMRDTRVAPDVKNFNAALKVCARERNPVNASIIFQQMATQGIVPDLQSWNTLLDTIGRAGQVELMLAKYREMCTSGQQPNRITLNTMLAHAAAAGRCGIVQDIWKEMHRLQLEPDVRSYTSRINFYATTKEPEKAEAVFAEMCQAANVKPNAFTFTSLMKAYIEVQRLDAAEQVISRMRSAGVQPSLPTWKSIIHAADTAGDLKRADQLYEDALLSGAIKPYRPWRSVKMKDASGNIQPNGTVMDLHKVNRGTGRAAIRHELRLRQSSASKRTNPLYIITGQGDGLLKAAVCDTLNAQGIHHLLPAAHPGRIIIPRSDA
ncbi:hypothetical protein JKP88DRAFT_253679 [Tribonema minus]|uniref:Pentatricopeptide repeat-containing protein n=1 Tax=Tribonema minus TaxID=303371 RepID=A0A836CK07_9STRA|nr:hypothetical protein JKP88DRAFT_253679 [Tribonema minus]